MLQYCAACNVYQYYARPLCAKCPAAEPEWREASGNGVLYSYSVVYRGPSPAFQSIVPYVTAIVELEEGPRMFTNIVDGTLSRCGWGAATRRVPGRAGGPAASLFHAGGG